MKAIIILENSLSVKLLNISLEILFSLSLCVTKYNRDPNAFSAHFSLSKAKPTDCN